jgi:hypothetical protein
MRLKLLLGLLVVFYCALFTPEEAKAQLESEAIACISSVTGFSVGALSTVLACNPLSIAASIPVCVAAVGGTVVMATEAASSCSDYYDQAHDLSGADYGGLELPDGSWTQNDCTRVSLHSVTGTSCANSEPVCVETTVYYHVLDPTGYCMP